MIRRRGLFRQRQITEGRSIILLLVVYYQRTDHARDPAAEGEEEDDQDRSAPFVDYRQGREEDAQKNAEKTHRDLRFANFD